VVRFAGPLYTALYFTVKHRFLGVTIANWFKNIPLLLALFGLLVRRPMVWVVAMLLLSLLIRLLYWQVRRDGYVIFVGTGEEAPPKETRAIPDDEKMPVIATGTFSVQNREKYVLRRPADYWRLPVGDHAIMVEHRPGRYLYQFIQPGTLEHIEPGLICFGRKPCRALAITFLSTWRSESNDVNFRFFAPSENGNPAKLRQKVYLSFDDQSDLEAVWRNLLRDARHPIDKLL
jgi:hypothetical protein